jgi:hypothetical protein
MFSGGARTKTEEAETNRIFSLCIHVGKLPPKHTVLGSLKCKLFRYVACSTQFAGFICLSSNKVSALRIVN